MSRKKRKRGPTTRPPIKATQLGRPAVELPKVASRPSASSPRVLGPPAAEPAKGTQLGRPSAELPKAVAPPAAPAPPASAVASPAPRAGAQPPPQPQSFPQVPPPVPQPAAQPAKAAAQPAQPQQPARPAKAVAQREPAPVPADRFSEPPRRRGRVAPVLVTGAIAAAGIVIYVMVRRGHNSPHAANGTAPTHAAARDASGVPDAAGPTLSYIGSAKCAECHTDEHRAWQKDWHARALAPATKASVVGDFSNVHFTGTSSEAWMKRDGAKYVMAAHGPDGTVADYKVDYVIGGKRMQDTLTVFPDGRWQILPVYYQVTQKQWVDYTEAKQGALTPEHPFYWTNARRMANHECLDCHTTGLTVGYDDKTRTWTTSFVDGTVACENCHGPGSKHADTQDAADIIHPGKQHEVAFDACGRCHGPRRPLFPLLDSTHPFRLGQQRYDEIYEPIVITLPDGYSPEFFADGRPKSSSFEYQAVLQSACYRKGGATCLACHTAPHEKHRGPELIGKTDAAPCGGCHGTIVTGVRAHSHHKSEAGQRCTGCHMPPIVSGVLDHFADHSLDVPDPSLTITHGVPNACSVCHADQTAQQLATTVASWWPNAAARQDRRRRLADAFDEAPAMATGRDRAKALVATIEDTAEAPTLRGAAAVVMARVFGVQTTGKLEPLLASDDVGLRAKGCEALAAAKATGTGDAIAALLADPSLRVRQACAIALLDLGDARGEAALADLASAPESDHLLLPHHELGTAYAKRQDWVAARRELTAAVLLAPYFPDFLVELAAVAAEQGDFAEARARLDQAAALAPKDPGVTGLRAKIDRANPPPAPAPAPAPAP